MNSAVQVLPSGQNVATVWADRSSKLQFALLLVLLTLLYASVFWHLAAQWAHDPNFSHGFFVPAFSLYLLWEQRARLASLCAEGTWAGLWLLGPGLAFLIIGTMGAELFLSRVSIVPVLGGLTALFLGWRFLRVAAFPWLFLLLMIPLPALIFNQITFPLQILASRIAANLLPILGVPVLREGNVIHLPAMALEVAEACSGIRSLMSLVTLAVMYGYLLERRWAFRALLALAAIPIAVAANSLRIVGTGLLVQYWDPDKAEGFFHTFSGWIIFIVSILLLFAVRRILHWILERKDGGLPPSPGNAS
jgi:exosortase